MRRQTPVNACEEVSALTSFNAPPSRKSTSQTASGFPVGSHQSRNCAGSTQAENSQSGVARTRRSIRIVWVAASTMKRPGVIMMAPCPVSGGASILPAGRTGLAICAGPVRSSRPGPAAPRAEGAGARLEYRDLTRSVRIATLPKSNSVFCVQKGKGTFRPPPFSVSHKSRSVHPGFHGPLAPAGRDAVADDQPVRPRRDLDG